MVSVVAGALLLAVTGTTLLLRLNASVHTRRELRTQAVAMARAIEVLEAPRALQAVGQALRLQGQQVVRFGPGGRTVDALPSGVSLQDLDLGQLRSGHAVTGTHGSLVFAAAPAPRRGGLFVVVLTRRVGTPLRSAAPIFAIAALVALGAAAVVAVDLGRRLTRPLRAAQAATGRIAAGDLAARVPEPVGDDELAQLSRSVNAMAEALERSRGLERQFLLSVSHDLRTPLTSIRGWAEAIVDRSAPDAPAAAGTILSEARRLERLVTDLLELAKLDARRFSLDTRAVDVGEVVTATVEGFRPAAETEGLTLRLEVEPATGTGAGTLAAADPDRLAQVVANLVENAVKFARGQIAVGTALDRDDVVLWVADDGPGMDAADLEHMFEPFYRSPRSAARTSGSGLGLAIVHQLVHAMGGTVTAATNKKGGCRMTVTLRPWKTAS
jgi:two-component system sensor histidine kinase BaeS